MSHDRPNILFVHCHDLGQYLHCYGVPTVRTPRLDAFAAEGVRFANSFCTAPQCSPSRASIFTGRYPESNGVLGLTHASFAWDLHPDERHLAQLLGEAGWRTACAGVIHETNGGAERCGYDEFMPNPWASQATGNAIDWLRTRSELGDDTPFFLSVGFLEPHRTLPEDSRADLGFLTNEFGPDTERGVYVPGHLLNTEGTREELGELQGAVHHVDTQFGQLMKTVDDLGLRENTLVIFTTDHGYAMPRAKASLYDPGMAVAFMLRYPARPGWHGGRTLNEFISNVDYLPTLFDLLGLDVPETVQGRSAAALLDGAAYTPREEVFGGMTYHDYYDPRRCVRTATHKLILNFTAAPAFMDPSQSWRPRADTVVPANHAFAYHDALELYDLSEDPWEQDDRSDDEGCQGVRDDLLQRLHAHMRDIGDPLLNGAVTSPLHHKALRLLEDRF